MTEPKFAPSILSADFARLAEAVVAVERAGADWIHVDVMDGHFVPNLTFGPKMVADLRKATRLPLDVHLMIERPEDWVDRYAEAGATYLTIHVEASGDVPGTLAAIRARGVRPGLTLNPETPARAILPHLASLDLALVMSVHPGHLSAELEVDGGIKPDNAARVAAAGATVLVAGSAIFEDPDGPLAALDKFKRAVRG